MKTTYVETIRVLAPNYLLERYTGSVSYPDGDESENGDCQVELEFSPYDEKRPGFSVYYPYKKEWKHIGRPHDIYAIIIEDDIVKLEIHDLPMGFKVEMRDPVKLNSFVSCIAGYYR